MMSTMTPAMNCAGGPAPIVDASSAYKKSPLPPWVDLRLDSNEGPPPSERLLETLTHRATAEILRRYPKTAAIETQIAQRLGIDSDRVVITAGGDDAIDRVCRAYLSPGREIILPVPTFEMIERYAALAKADVTRIPWPSGDFPTSRILAAASDRTAVVAVVSPNNPTGAVATRDDLVTLATRLPNVLFMVDLAYTEFAEQDLTQLALELPSCLVIRSMSKAWGLAGLRVGYAAGPAAIIAGLRAAGGPYAVSAVSAAIASTALDSCEDSLQRFVARVRTERTLLIDLLARLGEAPCASQANFVWCRFRRAAWVDRALRSLGIAVRRFADNAETSDYLRITCPGDESTFRRLCRALESILDPQAILFDMDGVIADVTESYRAAIIQTAAAFGESLTPSDISAAKTTGDSNNDWELTTRLLRERGCRAGYDEVKTRFEALYQGTDSTNGLHLRERLLVSKDWIERLSRRFTLGVVTGRPRVDAERFLRTADIRDCVRTLVCMEDAAAKPSPAPVRLAMQNLHVSRAWLLGDTSDDITAARSAGVLPIGVVAPGDRDVGRIALENAGAAVVLEQTRELEGLLS